MMGKTSFWRRRGRTPLGAAQSLVLLWSAVLLTLASTAGARADDAEESADAAMARMLQDPLATVSLINTDNSANFGMGDDEDVGYSFMVQPVYSIPAPELGVNFLPRAIIPIIGAPAGSDFPKLGEERQSRGGTTFGLSDIQAQLFVSPSGGEGLKWGVGPQISLRTRTDSKVAGPGWGAGPAGAIVGALGPWSFVMLAGNLWGQDGFNTGFFQPMVFYNFESLPGVYVGYNNAITADWNASSDNRYTVPVGLSFGKTFAFDGGYGLSLGTGAYAFPVKPDGGAEWQLKLGVTVVFPR